MTDYWKKFTNFKKTWQIGGKKTEFSKTKVTKIHKLVKKLHKVVKKIDKLVKKSHKLVEIITN